MTIQQQFEATVRKFNQNVAVPLGMGLSWQPSTGQPSTGRWYIHRLNDANSKYWQSYANRDRIPQLYSDSQAISIAKTLPNIKITDDGTLISLYGNYADPVIATM